MPKKSKFRKKTKKKLDTSLSSVSIKHLFGMVILSIFFFLLPGQNIYYHLTFSKEQEDLPFVEEPISNAPLPVNTTNYFPDYLTAEGVYIEDIVSNISLFEKNLDMNMAPASTTKMMTALVVLDVFYPDDVIEVKTLVKEGHLMELIEGERITVENLLYGILIHSGNDAAYTLAENFPGGVDEFVEAMNKKAKELNLSNTHFTNPIGFDDENHYSTPRDLARLAKVVLNNKTLAKMVGIPNITVSDVTYTHFHQYQLSLRMRHQQ